MLKIMFLGYPQVYVGEQLIEKFMSTKVVILLCYLIINPKIHSRERLAALLWGNMPDNKAKSNLRQALHDLNKRLNGYLDISRQTVQFHQITSCQVDVLELQAIANNPNSSITDLEYAATLYRGDFLEGVYLEQEGDLDDWLRAEQERLRLLYLDVLERLYVRLSNENRWKQAQQLLQESLRVEPLREATHRQLMEVYIHQTKWDEAIQQYAKCRTILVDSFGILPSKQSTRLYHYILWRRDYRPIQLPTYSGAFFGRERESTHVLNLFSSPDTRLVTIHGYGGSGKTRLAIQIARSLMGFFRDGILYLDLTEISAADRFVMLLAEALTLEAPPQSRVEEHIIDFLHDCEMLIILDNFEHVITARNTVEKIIRNTPNIKLLTTSRVRLGIAGENTLTIHGLATKSSQPDHVSAAVSLFQQELHRVRNTKDLDPHQLQSVEDICRRLEGLPLAIEMVASWSHMLSLEDIRTKLEEASFPLESQPTQNHHVSMRAIFDETRHQLSTLMRAKLPTLAVFRSGFDINAAKAICDIGLRNLSTLVDHALLKVDGHGRFYMHELVRQYVLDDLVADHAEYNSLQHHHMSYFLGVLSEKASLLDGESRSEVTQQLKGDHENIISAWRYAVHLKDDKHLFRSFMGLWHYLHSLMRYSECIQMFQEALAQLKPDQSPELAAHLHIRISMLQYYQMKNTSAYQHASTALGLTDSLKDVRIRADALFVLSAIEEHQTGNLTQAIHLAEQSLDICNNLDDYMVMKRLGALGVYHINAGHWETAKKVYQAHSELTHKLNMPDWELETLYGLARVAIQEGQSQLAIEYMRRADAIHDTYYDGYDISPEQLYYWGVVWLNNQDYRQARQQLLLVLELSDSVDHVYAVAMSKIGLARVALATGDPQSAQYWLYDIMDFFQRIDGVFPLVHALAIYAEWLQHTNRIRSATLLASLIYKHPHEFYEPRHQAAQILETANSPIYTSLEIHQAIPHLISGAEIHEEILHRLIQSIRQKPI
ncbi:MAG: BTAD domain-containing putative transcriptional regulator [Chloroflexota bacterium]